MDQQTLYQRSLYDVTALGPAAHQECRIVGDQACGRRVDVPYQPPKWSIQGFKWLPRKLQPTPLYPPETAYFVSRATKWEQSYSVLCGNELGNARPGEELPAGGEFVPVVDQVPLQEWGTFPVVAHYGKVQVDQIAVPRGFGTQSTDKAPEEQLQRILDQEIHAYVGFGRHGQYNDMSNWEQLAPFSTGYPVHITVLTDLDGLILANIGFSNEESGVESVAPPWEYVAIGTALFALGKAGAKLLMKALVRRAARKAEEKIAKKIIGDAEAMGTADRAREIAQAERYAARHDVEVVYRGKRARQQFGSPEGQKFPDVVAKKKDGTFTLGEGKGTQDIQKLIDQFDAAGRKIRAKGGRISEQEVTVGKLEQRNIDGQIVQSPANGAGVDNGGFLLDMRGPKPWPRVLVNGQPIKVVVHAP